MRLIPADRTDYLRFTIRWLTDAGIHEYTAQDFVTAVEYEKTKLAAVGVGKRDKVGIRGDNSYLWLVTDVALTELDAVSVVFPPEFKDRSNEELINDYALSFMILSDAGQPATGNNSAVAVMGQINHHHRVQEVKSDPYPVTDDDHSFVFSSGTSGTFKGMVISKKGVLDQVETFGLALGVSEFDRILLFMPFSSFQNRVLYYGAIMRDVEITAVPSTQLLEGLKRFQPTILIAPPIFYEAVEKNVRGALRKQSSVIRAGLKVISILTRMLSPIQNGHISDVIRCRVYSAAHSIFGGQIRIMVTGMAKIGTSTLEYYKSLGLPLVQVYGLTECGVVCANTLIDNEVGTVGKPLAGNSIFIAGDGEIVVKKNAPQTNRFFHFEASTEDTRFENGAIYTGDLGQISIEGRLTLMGRKKSTIVGHSGVKVQPELIEKRLEERELISKAVLVGIKEGRGLGIALQTTSTLSKDEQSSLDREAITLVESMAPSYKNHLQTAFSSEEFTADNGLLTRNLKINRSAVRKRFFEPKPSN